MINGFQYSCSNTAGVGVREKWWRMEKCFVCGVNGINSRRRNYGKFYKWLLNSSMGFASLLVIVIVTNEGLVLEVNIIFWGSVGRNNWVTNYQNYSNISKIYWKYLSSPHSNLHPHTYLSKCFTMSSYAARQFSQMPDLFVDRSSVRGEKFFPISQL